MKKKEKALIKVLMLKSQYNGMMDELKFHTKLMEEGENDNIWDELKESIEKQAEFGEGSNGDEYVIVGFTPDDAETMLDYLSFIISLGADDDIEDYFTQLKEKRTAQADVSE